MKIFEFNDENVIVNIKKEKRTKLLKAVICLIIGGFSLQLVQAIRYFNFYRDMANNVMLFILGIILVFCGSGIFFAFVKSTPKRNALFCGMLSLILASVLYYAHISSAYEGSWPGLENNWTACLIVIGVFHLVYAAVIFGGAMLITHLGGKIGLRKQEVHANS